VTGRILNFVSQGVRLAFLSRKHRGDSLCGRELISRFFRVECWTICHWNCRRPQKRIAVATLFVHRWRLVTLRRVHKACVMKHFLLFLCELRFAYYSPTPNSKSSSPVRRRDLKTAIASLKTNNSELHLRKILQTEM